jgi:hypothetical protein
LDAGFEAIAGEAGKSGELAEISKPVDKFAPGDGLHPGLGVLEGDRGGDFGLELLIEVDEEPGAGDFFHLPEGAENGLGSGAEEGAGESNVFGVLVGGGDRGFAGGEGDEVEVGEGEIGDRYARCDRACAQPDI